MPRDKNIFTLNPTSLDYKRSIFDRNSQHKTSFNLGEIVPIYFDEILPGDTVKMDLANVIRLSTPLAPIMDNLFCDIYAFFVPNRLTCEHWEEINGENKSSPWTQNVTYKVPMQEIGSSGSDTIQVGDLGDYLGLPAYGSIDSSLLISQPSSVKVSKIPGFAYYRICNEWFRNENITIPWSFTKYGSKLLKASRFHDYFSSALPAPQKGNSVLLPLGSSAKLMTGGDYTIGNTSNASVHFGSTGAGLLQGSVIQLLGIQEDSHAASDDFSVIADDVASSNQDYAIDRTNLYADLSNATAATVNQLRLAFQLQKLLEKDARGGTRYIEMLKAHFGVTSPDARLQRSEYLAGHRFRINVDQVVATADSGSSGSSIVGQTGAVSKTAGAASLFTKSFVEHGLLMVVAVVRQDHTYSQGIEKFWFKENRFDFYYPVLANIGEVAIKEIEVFAYNGRNYDLAEIPVFGYQEAWADYRYKPSRCSGLLNPTYSGSLNFWTAADVYTDPPGLNDTFMLEKSGFLDRCLAVPSGTSHNFIADFYFKCKFSREMPLYSIPGLIDHH